MTVDVGLADPDTLRKFATTVWEMLENMKVAARVRADIVPEVESTSPEGTPPALVGLLPAFRLANEDAVEAMYEYMQDSVRGLAGLAFTAGWIASNFPAVDLEAKRRLTALVDQAEASVRSPAQPPR